MRFKKYTIRHDDTLQSIAQRETGDFNNWLDIATYNDLEYPYIVTTEEEKFRNLEHTVTYGDQLVIPYDQSSLNTVNIDLLNKRDQEYIQNLTYGVDLDITSQPKDYSDVGTSHEILTLRGDARGDIRTVKGTENLKQAIILKLLTPRGTLLLHPNYGSKLHALFGKASPNQMRLIEIEVCRTVKTDSRVDSCELVDAVIKGDTYAGEYEVTIRSLQESFNLLLTGDTSGQFVVKESDGE